MSSPESGEKRSVCIIIPTLNGAQSLGPLLGVIRSQITDQYIRETLIIDSASSDATLQIAAQYEKTRVKSIPAGTFSHAGTRNLAASLTQSDYIIFLTQDALPANSNWLEELVRPLELRPDIAASYSRQIPRPGCNPLEARDIYSGAPPVDEIRYIDQGQEWQKNDYAKNYYRYIRFSNISACYRASVLKNNPFDESLKMVEDQAWAKQMIEKGLAIYYASKSIVIHSHEFDFRQIWRRYFDYGLSFKKFALSKHCPFSWQWFCGNVIQDALFILQNPGSLFWKIKWLTASPALRLSAWRGFRHGWCHE